MKIVDRTVVLDELKECTLEELQREVVRRQEALTVCLQDGETVAVQLSRRLKPLPELEGFIPEGWKQTIYG